MYHRPILWVWKKQQKGVLCKGFIKGEPLRCCCKLVRTLVNGFKGNWRYNPGRGPPFMRLFPTLLCSISNVRRSVKISSLTNRYGQKNIGLNQKCSNKLRLQRPWYISAARFQWMVSFSHLKNMTSQSSKFRSQVPNAQCMDWKKYRVYLLIYSPKTTQFCRVNNRPYIEHFQGGKSH